MHAGLLDMLHHAGDVDVAAVANGIDVDFDGAAQIAVKQHGRVAGDAHRLIDIAAQIFDILDNLHRLAAEDVGRADNDGKTDFFGRCHCFGFGSGKAVIGLAQADLLQQLSGNARGPPPSRWRPARCRGSARRPPAAC